MTETTISLEVLSWGVIIIALIVAVICAGGVVFFVWQAIRDKQ